MLRGAVVIVLLLLNTLWWGGLVLIVGFPKLFMPRSELRRRFILGLAWLDLVFTAILIGAAWVAIRSANEEAAVV